VIWRSEAAKQDVLTRYRAFLAMWPQPNAQRTVATRHGESFVMECGKTGAPALVLLHGSASNSFMWTRDAALWGQNFHVFAVDMIGEPGLSSENRPALASGAYAEWLEDVLEGLGVGKVALVGISLGAWLALDYASKRPERITAVAAMCPGGVGKHKNVLFWAAPLMLLGPWGIRKVRDIIAGPVPKDAPPLPPAVTEFLAAIFTNFRTRREQVPVIGDAALQRLTMPVLAILGGKDAMVDTPGTRRRLEASVPSAQIAWLPEQGHVLRDQAARIDGFLRRVHALA
jgi:pimeloyl-ACP methyl ester carboxylesterase